MFRWGLRKAAFAHSLPGHTDPLSPEERAVIGAEFRRSNSAIPCPAAPPCPHQRQHLGLQKPDRTAKACARRSEARRGEKAQNRNNYHAVVIDQAPRPLRPNPEIKLGDTDGFSLPVPRMPFHHHRRRLIGAQPTHAMPTVLILSSYVAASRVGGGAQAWRWRGSGSSRSWPDRALRPPSRLGRAGRRGRSRPRPFEAVLGGVGGAGRFREARRGDHRLFRPARNRWRSPAEAHGARARRPAGGADRGRSDHGRRRARASMCASRWPRPSPPSWSRGADILAPNAWELERLTGLPVRDAAGAPRRRAGAGRPALVSSVPARARDRGGLRRRPRAPAWPPTPRRPRPTARATCSACCSSPGCWTCEPKATLGLRGGGGGRRRRGRVGRRRRRSCRSAPCPSSTGPLAAGAARDAWRGLTADRSGSARRSFEPVREAFAANFAEGARAGRALCPGHRGRGGGRPDGRLRRPRPDPAVRPPTP